MVKMREASELGATQYTNRLLEAQAEKLDALIAEQRRTNQLLEWLGGLVANQPRPTQ